MRRDWGSLVDAAQVVSRELIRVAILWHEIWHEGLEEASRLWFGDRNVDGMLKTLYPLHKMMKKGPETLREMRFQQAFGRDLQDAKDCLDRFVRGRKEADLNQAWAGTTTCSGASTSSCPP